MPPEDIHQPEKIDESEISKTNNTPEKPEFSTSSHEHLIPSDLSDKDDPRKLPPQDFKFPQTKFDNLRSFCYHHLINYEILYLQLQFLW